VLPNKKETTNNSIKGKMISSDDSKNIKQGRKLVIECYIRASGQGQLFPGEWQS
jgi:hypothetical protein